MEKRNRILAARCFINLCLGSIYAWSVFSQAMTSYLNETAGLSLSPGDLAVVYTVANCIGPVTMIAGGSINDAFGPGKVILTGGIMFGGGLFLSGFARSVAFLVVSFGVIGGLGLGMAYGCAISTAVKFFPDKRGMVGGITTAAYGISSVIIPPVVSAVVRAYSAPFAFKATGILFIVVIAVSSLFVEKCPEDMNTKGSASAESAHDLDWRGMVKTPVFYMMLVLLICGAFSGMMVISQASQIAVNMMGMSVDTAAVTVSMLALFNTLGRLSAGSLSDHMGRIGTLSISCAGTVSAALLLVMAGRGGNLFFYTGIALVGMSFGAFMGVYPGFTADSFGARHNSVNYGIMCIGFALAGWLGPLLMKNIYNNAGSYTGAFITACFFAGAGLLLTFVIKAAAKAQHK